MSNPEKALIENMPKTTFSKFPPPGQSNRLRCRIEKKKANCHYPSLTYNTSYIFQETLDDEKLRLRGAGKGPRHRCVHVRPRTRSRRPRHGHRGLLTAGQLRNFEVMSRPLLDSSGHALRPKIEELGVARVTREEGFRASRRPGEGVNGEFGARGSAKRGCLCHSDGGWETSRKTDNGSIRELGVPRESRFFTAPSRRRSSG